MVEEADLEQPPRSEDAKPYHPRWGLELELYDSGSIHSILQDYYQLRICD